MSLHTVAGLAFALTLAPIRPAVSQDAHDYSPIGKIEGYKVIDYYEKRFDQYVLPLPDHTMTVEGHYIRIQYAPDGSQPSASALEINRSYKGVLDALGGEVLKYDESDGHGVIGRFTRNNGNVFIDVDVYGNGAGYYLNIVEERPFRSLIQLPAPAPKS